MNLNYPRLRSFAASLALCLAFPICAGEIRLDLATESAVPVMTNEAAVYIDAMQKIIEKKAPEMLNGSVNRFKHFRNKGVSDTLARIDYTFVDDNGTTITRRYHSRSGRPVQAKINERRTRPDDGSSGSDEATTEPTVEEKAQDIALDAEESAYYTYDSPTDVRAPVLPAEDSVLEDTDLGDFSRANDAELKAFRKIESDIQAGIAKRGGRITGYVSQAVCASCRHVVETFATEFDANGTIYQMLEPSASYSGDGSPASLEGSELQQTIEASRRGARQQRDFRLARTKEVLKPTPKPSPADRLSKRASAKLSAEAYRSADEPQEEIREVEGC